VVSFPSSLVDFLRLPSLHVLVFMKENVFVTLYVACTIVYSEYYNNQCRSVVVSELPGYPNRQDVRHTRKLMGGEKSGSSP